MLVNQILLHKSGLLCRSFVPKGEKKIAIDIKQYQQYLTIDG